MSTSALEKAQELEKQKQAVLQQGADEALAKAIAGFKELRALVDEQLKALNGWTLDGEGHALSKSKGAEEVEKVINKYGAELLRLWTASVDFTEDVRFSDTIVSRAKHRGWRWIGCDSRIRSCRRRWRNRPR